MKIIIQFFFILSVFLIIASNAYSGTYIEIKDTTLIRNGNTSKVPIYSNVVLNSNNNLSITLQLNSLLVDIKGVEGGPEFGINELNPNYELDKSNLTATKLTIKGSKLNPNYTGKLCNILLETLAGPDSITFITPQELAIQGLVDTNVTMKSGKIYIGIPVYEKITEGISEIFPNPFTDNSTISFIVKEDTKINFKFYSMLGRLVTSIPGETSIDYTFYDKMGNKIDDITDYTFTRGLYKMNFKAVNWLFSAGNYYVVMQTKLGTYHSNFIHIK